MDPNGEQRLPSKWSGSSTFRIRFARLTNDFQFNWISAILFNSSIQYRRHWIKEINYKLLQTPMVVTAEYPPFNKELSSNKNNAEKKYVKDLITTKSPRIDGSHWASEFSCCNPIYMLLNFNLNTTMQTHCSYAYFLSPLSLHLPPSPPPPHPAAKQFCRCILCPLVCRPRGCTDTHLSHYCCALWARNWNFASKIEAYW